MLDRVVHNRPTCHQRALVEALVRVNPRQFSVDLKGKFDMTPISLYLAPRSRPRRHTIARIIASITAVAIALLCGPSVIDQAASTVGIHSHLGATAQAAPSICLLDDTIYLPCPVGPGSTVRFECSTASAQCSPSSWKISIVDQPRNAVCLAQGCDTLRITLSSADLTDGDCWMRVSASSSVSSCRARA